MKTTENTIVLGLGEMTVSKDPSIVLVCLGLGSCVAVSDPETRLAGMAHIVLPASNGRQDQAVSKYADTAVPALFEEMRKKGAMASRIRVKIAGGAQMSLAPGLGNMFNIGESNVEAVKAIVAAQGVPILAAETGGRRGRTARLAVATGRFVVTSVGGELLEL